jgi:hemoglobin-like flavoprotein
MALQTELLRESLGVVVAKESEITRHFYEVLFARYPQVRPLFGRRHAAEQQQKMLQEAIVAVVDRIEDGAWLAQTLRAMGRQHIDYGVTEPMYPWVGECLLATFEDIAGEEWRPEYTQAWADAYAAISALMLQGATQTQAS